MKLDARGKPGLEFPRLNSNLVAAEWYDYLRLNCAKTIGAGFK